LVVVDLIEKVFGFDALFVLIKEIEIANRESEHIVLVVH
jgi:hypothetical protein